MTDSNHDGAPTEQSGDRNHRDAGPSEVRELRDAATLRALSHPIRVALLDALAVHGRLTATKAGELIGETATTCSFHLRQLGRYGFAQRVEGPDKRQRPWELTHVRLQFQINEDDPLAAEVASGVASAFRRLHLERLQTWQQTRSEWPAEWREAADQSQFILWATPDEINEVVDEYRRVLSRFKDRLVDVRRRPEGARPFEVLTFAYPIAGSEEEEE